MARLHQNYGNNKDQCTQYCNRLLKIDPSNEEATFMFANLMLTEAKTEEAIDTYIQLLDKEPANFNTLSQLIELLRRAGRIKDIDALVQRAEKNCQRINLAGLYYCKGLQKRFEGDPAGALKELNWARFDNVYGKSAIMNMIEIYLNPASEMMFSS